ncbi:Oxoglutarate/iron-dependent dioxygenase [uncultured Caudovirales phage]|uniref:Oxoglutarate/iron-dependent dioxygenase n=1 Tax=uncultured Caudovirales phage TaxID=2100421 RepID=A0A6J5NH19_9CAUD|nr:Oxoglutarate/iron-dependent dioxygenase [uncultured Caudovirales phage]
MSVIGNHLGGGVVLYKDAFNLDWDWMRNFCQDTLLEERKSMYTPGADPITGEDGYINKSNYFFKKDSLDCMPWRGSLIHQNSDTRVQETIDYLEGVKDACLQDYLHKFPLAGKCLWWRIRGHIVSYPKGSFLGLHADIQTEYEFGKPHPKDQLATRNVVSVVAYLNDCVDSEEDIDGTNFTGGLHYFNYLDITIKPQKGSIIFFPSNYVAAHEVKPITAGTRYSYLGWYCQGTPNPEVLENVVDPIAQPEAARKSSNLYMPTGYKLMES